MKSVQIAVLFLILGALAYLIMPSGPLWRRVSAGVLLTVAGHLWGLVKL